MEIILGRRALGKLSSNGHHEVNLGAKGKSGELAVADENGVWRTQTAQRKPKNERRDTKNLELAKVLLWKTDEDEDINPPAVAIRMDDREADDERTAEAKPTVSRNFYVRKKDLEEHGYPAGCPGCSSILKKAKNRRPHSAAYRQRLEEALKIPARRRLPTRGPPRP